MLKASTIYLSLAVISLFLMLFFPVFIIVHGDSFFYFSLNTLYFDDGVMYKYLKNHYFGIMNFLLITYTIASLFLFRRLKVQSLMTRMNYLFHIGFILILYFTLKTEISGWEEENVILYRGFYFPIASLTFLFLANRSIKQEIELIKAIEKII